MNPQPVAAVILWSDPGAMLVFDNGAGRDMLEGGIKRDDTANDTLYFKFHVDPQSDSTTEEYFAAFQINEGDAERLGIGNALKAWAYSAFVGQGQLAETSPSPNYIDLHSSTQDQSAAGTTASYELPRRGMERTIVFKVQYVAGGDDLVTVWLHPDLSPGANELYQPESLTTRFSANAAFDELRLRHGGGGTGWIFSGIAIATSFADFVDSSSAKPLPPAQDNNFTAQRLSFQSWQRETGMPRRAIRALAQTLDGFLWLGAEDGLARFDGSRFVNVDLDAFSPGANVRTLLGDSTGALWIGTSSNGLIQLANASFSHITTAQGLPTNSIAALLEDKAGRLWVGTEKGLVVLHQGQIVSVRNAEALRDHPINALCKDVAGDIWIAARGAGIFRYQANTLISINDPEMDSLLRQSHCLLVDRQNRIWTGSGEDFVLCWDSGQWRRFRIPRHSATPFVTALAEQTDGSVWAGSRSEGLFQFTEGKLAAVNLNSGLIDNRITALFVDQEGQLWVGRDSGLSRLRREQLFSLGQAEGLGFGAVHGLAEVAPGIIWANKPGDGLYRWDGRTFSRLSAAGLQSRDPDLGAMLVTRNGSCWVATTNGLLLYRDPQAVADESRLFALSSVTLTALAEGFDNNVWAGSRKGELWQLTQGQWQRFATLPTTNAITAIIPEPNGAVWASTAGSGLFYYHQTNQTVYNRSKGLLSDYICTLFRDNDDTLWIGTASSGLTRLRNGQLTSLTAQQGLPEDCITQILEDNSGRLWLGGSRGISSIHKSDFTMQPPPALPNVLPTFSGRTDGMSVDECAAGFFPSGLKTKSGLLWFPTLKGAVVVNPALLPTNTTAPKVILERVMVDDFPLSGFRPGIAQNISDTNSTQLRISAGKHRIEIHYTSINFENPERTQFRYQLVGVDAGWVHAGTRRSAFYNYVPPGKYSFHVAASNGGDIWRLAEATLTFEVASHIWQRWWVIGLMGILILATAITSARFVEKRKAQRRLKRLEQERALEQERHRIAQDLHDEMGAKLCRISFLSEHAQRNNTAQNEVRDQINTIADASRELLHTLDEIVWAVNPHNDTLEHVASYINQYAQNYFQNTGIQCELDMPDQFEAHPISSQTRHHLFLAVHEAFTNILKHSKATHTRVIMACANSEFLIRIEDNGKGFSPASNGDALHNGTADGLRNMRHRLESVGGSCRLDSTPNQGTKLVFFVPLKPNLTEKTFP